MGKQSAPVLDTTLAGISGIKGLPALSATDFNDLPLAIFKRKLLLLDLLLQRIILSDNPKFVVSYVKLLDELEAYIRMCNEQAGVPVPKYMAKPKPQKQTSQSKPSTAKQQATQSHPEPKPALIQHAAPAANTRHLLPNRSLRQKLSPNGLLPPPYPKSRNHCRPIRLFFWKTSPGVQILISRRRMWQTWSRSCEKSRRPTWHTRFPDPLWVPLQEGGE
jgi:hypothetical protein